VRPRTPASLASARCASPLLLAKKPFKGGRLDDFLSAGEAEAKFGPSRYAQVAEDAWKIQVERTRVDEERTRTMAGFEAQKRQMLADHAFLSLLGGAVLWSCFDEKATVSFAVGAALGGLYLYLQQRAIDSVGASTVEEINRLPPPIVAPVLLVGLVAKNSAMLALLPAFGGFATHQLAIIAQLAYPSGWGVPPDDAPSTVDAAEA